MPKPIVTEFASIARSASINTRSKNDSIRYQNKKFQEAKFTVPTFIDLFDSSVQNSKSVTKRDGSTLCHMTSGTFAKVGTIIKSDMKDKGTSKKNLSHTPFFDVGAGLCSGLVAMHIQHRCNCVGLEQDELTFEGSELLQDYVMKKLELDKKPFIPIHGDAYNLKGFGGARIVYMWIKGVAPDLEDYLINVFINDKHAMYLVTHVPARLNKELETLRLVKSFIGSFAKSSSKMQMHIYAKKELTMSNDHIKKVNGEGLSDKIANAFFEHKTFSGNHKK